MSCWKLAGRGRSRFHNSHSYWNKVPPLGRGGLRPPPASYWNLVPALVVVLEPIFPSYFIWWDPWPLKRIINYVCWFTDAIDFETALLQTKKKFKFNKIAVVIIICSAILTNFNFFLVWRRFVSKSIASVNQQT